MRKLRAGRRSAASSFTQLQVLALGPVSTAILAGSNSARRTQGGRPFRVHVDRESLYPGRADRPKAGAVLRFLKRSAAPAAERGARCRNGRTTIIASSFAPASACFQECRRRNALPRWQMSPPASIIAPAPTVALVAHGADGAAHCVLPAASYPPSPTLPSTTDNDVNAARCNDCAGALCPQPLLTGASPIAEQDAQGVWRASVRRTALAA